jgi:RNA polymerase sigma-32 factor
MGYRGYGLPVSELISEGQYRPDAGREEVRARSRLPPRDLCDVVDQGSMQEFILRSWSLVKMGTTAAQKKLFFNLRRMKKNLEAFEDGDLHPEDVTKIATDLGVSEDEVVKHEPPHGDGRRYLAQRLDARGWRRPVAGHGWRMTARCRTSASPTPRKGIRHSLLLEAMDSLNDRERTS